jgi:hypothetical protein
MRDVIVHQANCVFDVLEQMLRSIPSGEMNVGDKPREVLGRQALHILGAFDRYGRKGHNWSKPFGATYGTFGRRYDADELPSRRKILSYLKTVKEQFAAFIGNLPDGYLSKPAANKRGRYAARLGKYIYLIRHNTLHLGYMRNMMIDRGYKPAEFK